MYFGQMSGENNILLVKKHIVSASSSGALQSTTLSLTSGFAPFLGASEK